MKRLATIALAATLAASCISADWDRVVEFEPLNDAQLDALDIGGADLADCLAALGAPIQVWETPSGAALAWYWLDSSNVGATISVPTGEAVSANFSYGSISKEADGALLLFDEAWSLIGLRRGQITEILPNELRRPSLDLDALLAPGAK